MAETNDTYQTPERATTKFVDDTYIALHEGSIDLIPHENVRLAREAMSLATSSVAERPNTISQEREALPNPTLGEMGAKIVEMRRYKRDSQLQLFDEAA